MIKTHAAHRCVQSQFLRIERLMLSRICIRSKIADRLKTEPHLDLNDSGVDVIFFEYLSLERRNAARYPDCARGNEQCTDVPIPTPTMSYGAPLNRESVHESSAAIHRGYATTATAALQ